MEVKDAVAKAKAYVEELFAGEGVVDVRLEEVEHDEAQGAWNITLGFLRRAEAEAERLDPFTTGLSAALRAIATQTRSYRVVRIRENDGAVLSVKRKDMMSDAA